MSEELSGKQQLLEAGELSDRDVDAFLGRLMAHEVDTGELFFQRVTDEQWVLEDSTVKDGAYSVDQGVGVRAIKDDKTGFAYANDIRAGALEEATNAAKSIAKQGTSAVAPLTDQTTPIPRYQALDPIRSAASADKVAFLSKIDTFTRNLDPRITEVNVSLNANLDTMFVHRSDGTSQSDIRPLIRFNVSVIAEENGRRERGYAGGGGRFDLGWLLNSQRAERLAREAVRSALINLEAIDAPAGEMTVVLGPGWPGILLHEAVGHGLEGDFNRKGTSVFTGKIGEKVASELCTVIDDATIPDRRGSLTIDDEGTPGQRTVLIENGILRGYMQDKLNAKLTGNAPTGNGRRQAYNCVTMPRMTNTFMMAGESDPEEIIRSVDRGVYAVAFSGGQVDITSGKFVFAAIEAYQIENGKKTAPLRGATLIGDGFDVMNNISMVGNDFAMDEGVGTCGKDGQSVPVGVGQPTLKVDRLRVGGTNV